MDPIMKLLEEDEDETMHSGAAVEAFTAALNRDIGGDTSTSQPAHSASALMPQGSNQMSSLYPQWQSSNQDESSNNQSQPDLMNLDQQANHSTELDVKPSVSGTESQRNEANAPHAPSELLLQQKKTQGNDQDQREDKKALRLSQPSGMQMLEKGRSQIQGPGVMQHPSRESQFSNMQKFDSQPASVSEQANNPGNRAKQIPFGSLLPIIVPELDKDRAMQLQTLYARLRKNEIPKEGFVRLMRSIVGDQMLKVAVVKMQSKMARESQPGPNQLQLPSQNPMQQQHLRAPVSSAAHSNDPYQFAQLHQRSQGQQNIPWQTTTSEEQKFRATSSMAYVKQEPVDPTSNQQNRPPVTTSHGTSFGVPQVEQGSTTPGVLSDEALDRQSSRTTFMPTTAVPQNSMSSSMTGLSSTDFQAGPQIPSSPAVMPGSNTKAAPKKSSAGQKKPFDAVGSSPPLPSKKQKVSGAFSDQSIEHLNDVTAVSGVNLREEEEQLFSGTKDDTRASEASRRVVQEEEDKLVLQKLPLQKKLAEIMTKCGLKNLSNDVERCLSLCVEERLRGLLSSMIRISRQRVDSEKSRHRTVITSDVRRQILAINRKAKEEWEKKQAEADKLQKLDEPDNTAGVDGDKEKDENRAKSLKVNKEEDDKMRTTAANVAARAAVGGDDMLSKWQLMAEQARQKREGVADAVSGSHPGKESNRRNSSSSRNQGAGKKDQSVSSASGASRRLGRNQSSVYYPEAARNISVKDVIAVLEREPQTAKSTMLYRLYEKVNADALSEQSKGHTAG